MSKVNVVVIDPGHGGDDNGASYGYEDEDDFALSVSYLLRCELEKESVVVFLTRERHTLLSYTAFHGLSVSRNAEGRGD